MMPCLRSLIISVLLLASIPNLYGQTDCPNLKTDTVYHYGTDKKVQKITYTCNDTLKWIKLFSIEGQLTNENAYILLKDNSRRKSENWVLHGAQRTYHLGKLVTEKEYIRNRACGKDVQYNNYGQLIRSLSYICVDSNNTIYSLPHGKYVEYDVYTLKKKEEAEFDRGKYNGTWKKYYPDGTLQYESVWRDGMRSGDEKYYHSSGKLIKKYSYKITLSGKYLTSVVNGDYIEYNSSSLLLIRKGNYKMGKKNGLCIEYNNFAQVRSKIKYTNDCPSGVYETYYENGKIHIKASCYYKKGMLCNSYTSFDGSYQEFREDGSLIKKCGFKKGKLDGDYYEYAADGKVTRFTEYQNGLYSGKDQIFRAYHTQYSLTNYKIFGSKDSAYSLKHGPFEQVSGNVTTKGTYERGKLNGEYLQYRDEKLVTRYNYRNDMQTGLQMQFSPSGDTISYAEFEIFTENGSTRGFMHGRYTVWSLEGHIVTNNLYIKGKLINSRETMDGKPYSQYMGWVPTTNESTYGMSLRYYSDGSLRSITIGFGGNPPIFRLTWFPDGNLQAAIFLRAEGEMSTCSLTFAADKSITGAYISQGSGIMKLLNEAEARRLYELIPSRDAIQKAITGGEWDKAVEIKYADGSPMLAVNNSSLAGNGTQAVFSPYHDTLLLVDMKMGIHHGKYLHNGGRNFYTRGEYYDGKYAGTWIFNNGYRRPHQVDEYDSAGRKKKQFNWYLGTDTMQEFLDVRTGEHRYWYYNGIMSYESVPLEGDSSTYRRETSYFENGRARKVTLLNNMGRQGTEYEYWENGRPASVIRLVNNIAEGMYERYYPNGRLAARGMFVKNQREGEWENYDTLGNRTVYKFSKGILIPESNRRPCSCIDTSKVKSGFVPSLSTLTSMNAKELARIGEGLFQPLDSSLLNSVFYEDLYVDDYESKSYSMTLVCYQELGFWIGDPWGVKLIINPCLSVVMEHHIPFSLRYTTKNDRITEINADISSPKMALEFDSSWLNFYDSTRGTAMREKGRLVPYRALFNTYSLSYSSRSGGSFAFDSPSPDNSCALTTVISPSNNVLFNFDNYYPHLSRQGMDNRISGFINTSQYRIKVNHESDFDRKGLVVTSGRMKLRNYGRPYQFDIQYLFVSNNYYYGVIKSDGKLQNDGQILFINAEGQEQRVSLQDFRQVLSNTFNEEVYITFNHNNEALIYLSHVH